MFDIVLKRFSILLIV